MAVAGLSVVGRQKYGVYPLRGKVLNVSDVAPQRIAENAEIANLKKIMGLAAGKHYASTKELRYGRIMILTDADTDGAHIKGLVMNLFAHQWPSLLAIDGFICSMLTPIVKVTFVSSNSVPKMKQTIAFYSNAELQAWRAVNSELDVTSKYYKVQGYKMQSAYRASCLLPSYPSTCRDSAPARPSRPRSTSRT